VQDLSTIRDNSTAALRTKRAAAPSDASCGRSKILHCSASVPLSKDGTALRDAAGKIRYSPIVSFDSRQAGDWFNAGVFDALRLAYPEIFAADTEVVT
jgi:hypothetical protein